MLQMSEQQLPVYAAEAKERIEAFRASLTEESDRGLVLVGGAFLEEELKVLLRSYLAFERSSFPSASQTTKVLEDTVSSLFSFSGGPLGTFVGKLNLAFSMGLLEEYEFHNLEKFSKVRNKFAHKIEASTLESPEVIDLIKNFVGKKANRVTVADKVAKLAYQIVTRTVILSDGGLDANKKKFYLGFAAGDPYDLKKRT